jgi:hypothetical protein
MTHIYQRCQGKSLIQTSTQKQSHKQTSSKQSEKQCRLVTHQPAKTSLQNKQELISFSLDFSR